MGAATTAEAYGITNLGDLADPALVALFDHDGDSRANPIGCNAGWSCAEIIDHHLTAYGLTGTVEHVQGDYSPLVTEQALSNRASQS